MAVDRFRVGMTSGDLESVVAVLAADVRLFSPTLHHPFEGLARARAVLGAAMAVIDDLHYVEELGGTTHGLIFHGRVGDRDIHGIDLIELDDDGRIATLTIMVRPLSGLVALKDAMAKALSAQDGDTR